VVANVTTTVPADGEEPVWHIQKLLEFKLGSTSSHAPPPSWPVIPVISFPPPIDVPHTISTESAAGVNDAEVIVKLA
jgi:hypothetical protein